MPNFLSSKRRAHRRRPHGLTLIEILTVVAILGLLAAVLIMYLAPSSDRRCRLEAERLAAFLGGTAAEAIMRDAPVRVAFNLETQICPRERARIGAALNEGTWALSPTVEPFAVRPPVRIAELLTPAITLTNGTGYILFDGRQTAGGVVVLKLESSVYSVVVSPTGPVRVEKGRVKLPEQGDGVRRRSLAPGPELVLGEPGTRSPFHFGAQSPPPPASPGPTSPAPSEPAEPSEPQDDLDEPPSLDAGFDPDPYDASFEPPPVDAEVEPDAEEEDECEQDEDCAEMGIWRRCGDDGRCYIDLSRKTFRMANPMVTEPQSIRLALQGLLADAMAENELNLLVQFDTIRQRTERPDRPLGSDYTYDGWVIQARQAGIGYRVHEDLPAYRQQASPQSCSSDLCHQFAGPNGTPVRVDLWLPSSSSGSCGYNKLSLLARIDLNISLGATEDQIGAYITLSGFVTKDEAENIKIGDDLTLYDLLEASSVDQGYDSNNDGEPDAWQVSFGGQARQVPFSGVAAVAEGRIPPGCSN